MTDPLSQVERLISEKKATYFSAGISSSVKGCYFFTIWGRPASETLANGHADTIREAAMIALSKIETKPVQIETRLPELTTRMELPGL